jgi:hypothetical protein
VLEYLVSSKIRRRLLTLLWREGARGTASSLARRAGTPIGASYGELKAMNRAGLARATLESGRVVYEAERGSPYADALRKLFSASSEATGVRSELAEHSDELRKELAAHGAPLAVPASPVPALPLEELLARACELARADRSIAEVLPALLVKKKDELDFERLARALAERGQKHSGGFMLAVASSLCGDKALSAWARRLKDKRRTRASDFFVDTPADTSAADERGSFALARSWSFRMPLAMRDFRSASERFGAKARVRRRS